MADSAGLRLQGSRGLRCHHQGPGRLPDRGVDRRGHDAAGQPPGCGRALYRAAGGEAAVRRVSPGLAAARTALVAMASAAATAAMSVVVSATLFGSGAGINFVESISAAGDHHLDGGPSLIAMHSVYAVLASRFDASADASGKRRFARPAGARDAPAACSESRRAGCPARRRPHPPGLRRGPAHFAAYAPGNPLYGNGANRVPCRVISRQTPPVM